MVILMIFFPDAIENFSLISVLDYTWEEREAVAAPRPFHALSFRVEGECSYETDKEEITIFSHDLLFVPAHVGYVQKIKKTEHLYCVLFHASLPPQKQITAFTPQNPLVFEQLFSSMSRCWTKKLPGYLAESTSYFYKLIAKLQSQQNELQLTKIQKNFDDGLEYLHSNFTRPDLTVKEIADATAVSESYFRKQFKSLKGCSPMEYINELRINHALELLYSNFYKIYEIAEKCGFSDSKYFSTVIKKKTGLSPVQIKKRM